MSLYHLFMTKKSKSGYTVKQVAKLAGVSVRALHFYDEIGLLKPASYGENGYRYYEKEQLLILQQILFYRELGFELKAMQDLIGNPKFDKIAALRSHREHLARESARTRKLLATIDKTIAHLEQEKPLADKDLYVGFDPKKQAEYEAYLIERHGESARKHIAESKERTKNWKKEDFQNTAKDYDNLHRAFTDAINRALSPEHGEVQNLVEKHYAIVNRFWTPNRVAYVALGRSYCQHPDFLKLYQSYHPRLAEYLAEAMKVYAETELSA